MQRPLCAALVALVLTAWTAEAHAIAPPDPSLPPVRVIMDTTVLVTPPNQEELCTEIEAGLLTVTARLVAGSAPQPTRLTFVSYRGNDPEADVRLTVDADEATVRVPLSGAIYCWAIDVTTPAVDALDAAEHEGFTQKVALRMTLAPQ